MQFACTIWQVNDNHEVIAAWKKDDFFSLLSGSEPLSPETESKCCTNELHWPLYFQIFLCCRLFACFHTTISVWSQTVFNCERKMKSFITLTYCKFKLKSLIYRKDIEHLYHAFMHSPVSPLSGIYFTSFSNISNCINLNLN